MQSNYVNGLIAPREIMPLVHDPIIVEQHDCEIA